MAEENQNERALPLKKRRYAQLYNYQEEDINNNNENEEEINNNNNDQDNDNINNEQKIVNDQENLGGVLQEIPEDNMEEKVEEALISIEEEVTKSKDEEEEKDMGIKVSNPIALIAMVASWLVESEALVDKQEIEPIPRAYAVVIDEPENEFEKEPEKINETEDDDHINLLMVPLEKDSISELTSQLSGISIDEDAKERSIRRRRRRSHYLRKPRSDYTSLNPTCAYIMPERERELKDNGKSNNDLYTSVKRRRALAAVTGGGSRRPRTIVKLQRALSAVTGGGSRCTRMSGKGWRCITSTTVGYKLCNSHLGRERNAGPTKRSAKAIMKAANSTAGPAKLLPAVVRSSSKNAIPFWNKQRKTEGVTRTGPSKLLLPAEDRSKSAVSFWNMQSENEGATMVGPAKLLLPAKNRSKGGVPSCDNPADPKGATKFRSLNDLYHETEMISRWQMDWEVE